MLEITTKIEPKKKNKAKMPRAKKLNESIKSLLFVILLKIL